MDHLQKKAKAIFQAKEAQVNFRNNFTPSKHSLFSQNNLVELKIKCAKLLADIIVRIAKEPGKSVITGQGRNTRVQLPRLFGEEMMKTKVLPLAYCGTNSANEWKRCDSPGCMVYTDEEWVVLEGCSHSFHVRCLDDSKCCPLCQTFLREKAKELAETAQKAILQPKESRPTDNESSDDEDNEEDDAQHPRLIGSENSNNNQKIEVLNQSLAVLSSPLPPLPVPPQDTGTESSRNISDSKKSKKPCCRKCKHPKKGHKYPKNECVKCPLCPESICQSETCQVPIQSTMYRSVTCWQLPAQISQSTIFGTAIGSNACTIIAVMGAKKFLNSELAIPTPQNIQACIASFANTMVEGNIYYNSLQLPPYQPNLDVKETLQTKSDHFGLKITEDLGLFSPEFLENKLTDISYQTEHCCGILITPPDKTMLLCFSRPKQTIALFESHTHGTRGGLIAVCNYGKIPDLVLFLEHMCQRD